MTHTILTASLMALSLALPAHAQTPVPPAIARVNDAATRGPTDASTVGALHEFAFERGAIYAIEASPQRLTDIALEPGESLLSVSAGDTTRWIVGDAQSGSGATAQAHILVKPNAAGLATNLVIMTDRRVYHLDLRSTAGPAMAAIAWRHPTEIRPQPAPPTLTRQPPFTPTALNLRYRIEGDRTDWRPLAAFDDGQQVFIEMPERIHTMEAPPLFVLGDDGPELVNYRITSNYYVVDRLFAKAELRLGAGRKMKTVRIIRQTPIAGASNG